MVPPETPGTLSAIAMQNPLTKLMSIDISAVRDTDFIRDIFILTHSQLILHMQRR